MRSHAIFSKKENMTFTKLIHLKEYFVHLPEENLVRQKQGVSYLMPKYL